MKTSFDSASGSLSRTVALVVTHRRPRLCTHLVRQLVATEGFEPEQIVVVVNGEGGLLEEDLERDVDLVRLPVNVGPAGGFKEGLERALRSTDARWIYVCEDDLPLDHMNLPRVGGLVQEVERLDALGPPIGAVTSWGRRQDPETGVSRPYMVEGDGRFRSIDVAGWGATLLSRRVLEAGILPDEDFFFGYEDWDFWIRLRERGFRLLIDTHALKTEMYGSARAFLRPQKLHRVGWRGYYETRNFFELCRRYGNRRWTLEHLIVTARLLRRARTWSRRVAILAGVVDGVRGRLGFNERFRRPAREDEASDALAPAPERSQHDERSTPEPTTGSR